MLGKAVKNIRTRRADKAGASFLTFDVGTEWAKALVVACGPPRVLGVGRARQRLGDMDGGAVAHIEGAASSIRQALLEAEALAGVRPHGCIAGIAGELVQGVAVDVQRERRHPDRPISLAEINRLTTSALPQAQHIASQKIAVTSGLDAPYLELVDKVVVDVAVDGYRVTQPLGFRGKYLQMKVFHTFSPLVHVRALQSVVEQSGCELLGLVAEPVAVAACALPPEAYELGAVVVDIGGGSTDVAVVEKRGLVGAKMVAMGGRAFTRSLADAFGLDMVAAEDLKLDYAAGSLAPEVAVRVSCVVKDDIQVLRDALYFACSDLRDGGTLPPRIYLCGGGSGLPGISEMLSDPAWVRSKIFNRAPVVSQLNPQEITGVEDPQNFLQSVRDVTPKALANQGVRMLTGNERIWRSALAATNEGVEA